MIFDEEKFSQIIEDAVQRALKSAAIPGADDGYISIAAAAERADVNPATIRSWQDAGRLPTYWAGRERRVLRSDLDALMKQPPTRADGEASANSPEALARRSFEKRE